MLVKNMLRENLTRKNFWLVILCVAPLNLIKGAAISTITMLVYKKLSPVLKAGYAPAVVSKKKVHE